MDQFQHLTAFWSRARLSVTLRGVTVAVMCLVLPGLSYGTEQTIQPESENTEEQKIQPQSEKIEEQTIEPATVDTDNTLVSVEQPVESPLSMGELGRLIEEQRSLLQQQDG